MATDWLLAPEAGSPKFQEYAAAQGEVVTEKIVSRLGPQVYPAVAVLGGASLISTSSTAKPSNPLHILPEPNWNRNMTWGSPANIAKVCLAGSH